MKDQFKVNYSPPDVREVLAQNCSGRIGTCPFKIWGEGQKLAAILLTSADETATAGLAAMVKRYGCAVISPRVALDRVRSLCPPGTRVLTEDELEKSGWLDVRVIPLEGRGVAPAGLSGALGRQDRPVFGPDSAEAE